MPLVTFRGSSRRDEDVGSVSVTVEGKDYLLVRDVEQDVPAAVVKRLQEDDLKHYNIDAGKAA